MSIAGDSASLQIPQTDPPPDDNTVNVSGHEDPARVPVTSASAPAAGTTENTRPGRLTLALPLDDAATQYRYAVVPLPKTHSEAITATARVFGNFLIDPTPERIVLRLRIKSKENEWIWADVDPSNWGKLVAANDQVGIFKNRAFLKNFLYGKVLLSYGHRQTKNSSTSWSDVLNFKDEIHIPALIDRPISYQDAVQTVKAKVQSRDLFSNSIGPAAKWSEDEWANGSSKLKFYTRSGGTWKEMNPITYVDDKRWRLSVPEPGEVLGVMVDYEQKHPRPAPSKDWEKSEM